MNNHLFGRFFVQSLWQIRDERYDEMRNKPQNQRNISRKTSHKTDRQQRTGKRTWRGTWRPSEQRFNDLNNDSSHGMSKTSSRARGLQLQLPLVHSHDQSYLFSGPPTTPPPSFVFISSKMAVLYCRATERGLAFFFSPVLTTFLIVPTLYTSLCLGGQTNPYQRVSLSTIYRRPILIVPTSPAMPLRRASTNLRMKFR